MSPSLSHVAVVTSIQPVMIRPLANQSVAVSGVSLPNVSSDSSAFLLALSCSSPSVTSPASVASTSISNSGSGATISLTVTATGAAGGAYRLCARWGTTANYFDAGSFSIFVPSSLVPSAIPSAPSAQPVSVVGAGLVDLSADAVAYFFTNAMSCAGALPAGVASLTEVHVSSTLTRLMVTTASIGNYRLCIRFVAAPNSYFDSGLMLGVGLLSV